ncbi:MAG: GNAT family N-acetyltransferase [Saprospiraceae bacterium]|nr:GNAT family N-acetyltransferase [Saprospiraceae bacterium]
MNLLFQEIEFASPEYDEALGLRNRILRIPLGLEFVESQIEEEFNQFHFVLKDTTQGIVGCLVFKKIKEDTLKMRQVAIDDPFQSRGCGTLLICNAEKWAEQNNYTFIELNARESAVDFYRKLAYSIQGNKFFEVGIPHFKMIKKLK